MINLFYKKKDFLLTYHFIRWRKSIFMFFMLCWKKTLVSFWIYDNSGEKHLIDNEKRLDEIFVLLKNIKNKI